MTEFWSIHLMLLGHHHLLGLRHPEPQLGVPKWKRWNCFVFGCSYVSSWAAVAYKWPRILRRGNLGQRLMSSSGTTVAENEEVINI
ncbi:hypothetical protein EVAR_31931_1 [Eumeta japonica]|uniref:Uncharacterized protein n=1 Tax=Eumeta variegata TaxID=151549 RepID=A0A4C1WTF5_EUMVA|nr:hypothetical protein EVAR_31931_1 [Eumeta japonica]